MNDVVERMNAAGDEHVDALLSRARSKYQRQPRQRRGFRRQRLLSQVPVLQLRQAERLRH